MNYTARDAWNRCSTKGNPIEAIQGKPSLVFCHLTNLGRSKDSSGNLQVGLPWTLNNASLRKRLKTFQVFCHPGFQAKNQISKTPQRGYFFHQQILIIFKCLETGKFTCGLKKKKFNKLFCIFCTCCMRSWGEVWALDSFLLTPPPFL